MSSTPPQSTSPTPPEHEATTPDRVRRWMRSDVTVTLPGWAFALGGLAALALVLIALD